MFPTVSGHTGSTLPGTDETVKLWDKLPGNHHGQTIQVSSVAMRDIKRCREALGFIHEAFPHGPGNQQTSLVASQGENYQRVVAARYIKTRELRDDPQRQVKASFQTGGINCEELADVTKAVLAMLGLERPVYTHQVAGLDHVVSVIGDQRADRDVVVAENWPVLSTGGMLLQHSRLPPLGALIAAQMPSQPAPLTEDQILDTMAQALDDQRIEHINASEQTPPYHELKQLSQAPGSRFYKQLHGMTNLGIRYQDENDATQVATQSIARDRYEQHASALREARAQGMADLPPLYPED
ncbi:hypothetical protein [Pseudomonas typographi]|uniref:hypothetical protein n=1 Tax=Pseudomonas typographi TaxID=2715964 RepID=UPI001684B424|nr:hypothetical protein [Pseudomonas typographi]MBD1552265.1 hypothetical protein [Pseudomonas typographi]